MQEHIELLKKYGLEWELSFEDDDLWRKTYLTFPKCFQTAEIWQKLEKSAAELVAMKIAGLHEHPMQIADKNVFLHQFKIKEDENAYCKFLFSFVKVGYRKHQEELGLYVYFDTDHTIKELRMNRPNETNEILKDVMEMFSKEDKMKMLFDSEYKKSEIDAILIKSGLRLMRRVEEALNQSDFKKEFENISIKRINQARIEKIKI